MMHFIKKWALVSWVSALATGVQAMPVEQGAEAAHSASCYELLLNVQPGFFASQLAQAYQQQLQTKGLEKGTIKHLTQEEFVQQIQANAASACVRLFIQPMASALRFSEALQDSVIVTVLGESSVALIGSTDLAAADAQEWLQHVVTKNSKEALQALLDGVDLSDSQLQYWNAVFNQASVAPALLQQLAPRGFATLQLTQPQSQAYQDQYVAKYSPIYQRF